MLKVTNLNVKLAEEDKQILFDVNLEINSGEVHLINGRNGSGKSTLVNTIMGHPNFEVLSGRVEILDEEYPVHLIEKLEEIIIKSPKSRVQSPNVQNPKSKLQNSNKKINLDLSEAEPDQKSLAGIYLASQYPIEIPGVNLTNFLRLIYNVRQAKDLPVFKFKKLLEEKARVINYPEHLLKRNLNEGFSGGEKKKTEILQMLVLEPRYVLLDEIDSGLDKHSVKEVFGGLASIKEVFPHTAFVIITHYDKAQEYLQPNYVHEMVEGKLVIE